MRILFLGGTRFIGPFAVRMLLEQGHDVAVFHRGQSRVNLPAEAREFLGDQEHIKDYSGALREYNPELVIDMIARTAQDAWNAISIFRKRACRIVVISSGDVYRNYNRLIGNESGPPDPVPLVEDAPLRHLLYPLRTKWPGDGPPPAWASEYEKILVERVALGERDLEATILRLPAVYGPNDRQHRLYPYVQRMAAGQPFILLGRQAARWRTSRGYVENIAAAIALAASHPNAGGKVFNVAWTRAITEADWVRSIAAHMGWQGEILTLPDDQLPAHLRADYDWTQHLELDTTRIRMELGYTEPVSREVSLRRAAEWERDNPPPPGSCQPIDYAAELEAARRANLIES